MNILVVGGGGYIGSHMVKSLLRARHAVTVLDDLSSGDRGAVTGGDFIEGSTADRGLLAELFASRRFDGVMHFASCIEVGESVLNPGKYYRNNVSNSLNLLDAMVEHGVGRFIFSSTAAVYGEPEYVPIDERHPLKPLNPYGRSKLMLERALEDYDHAHGLRSVCLRYFNAAGADPEGELGECHDPETHLIPLVLQAASGRREAITIHGRDYETPDGTCVRDYVHVADLCAAHLLALQALMDGAKSDVYNLGNGDGYSVLQVVETARRISGKSFRVIDGPRRAGDPARLIADSAKARQFLGWRPRHASLEEIIAHAWHWEQKAGCCVLRQTS